jgi:hypothetical protein
MIPVQSGEQQSAAAHAAAAARHHHHSSCVERVKKCLGCFDVNFWSIFSFFAGEIKVRSSRQKITLRVQQRTTKNSDNVRLNHENCVFGWNLGFFHVHEQQRYAVLNVRVLSFREEQRAFFLLSFLSQIEL